MTEQDIIEKLDSLAPAMVEKDFKSPRAYIRLQSETGLRQIDLNWDGVCGTYSECKTFSGYEPFAKVFDQVSAWIAEQPDAETREYHACQADLGRTIDRFRAAGLEVGALVGVAKNLAENAITDQSKTVAAE